MARLGTVMVEPPIGRGVERRRDDVTMTHPRATLSVAPPTSDRTPTMRTPSVSSRQPMSRDLTPSGHGPLGGVVIRRFARSRRVRLLHFSLRCTPHALLVDGVRL